MGRMLFFPKYQRGALYFKVFQISSAEKFSNLFSYWETLIELEMQESPIVYQEFFVKEIEWRKTGTYLSWLCIR
jgi:hypothetical protein